MASQKKQLYMACNIQKLQYKSTIYIISSVRKDPKRIIICIKELNHLLQESLLKVEQDEEFNYFLSFRTMIFWEALQLTDDYKQDNSIFQLLAGRYIRKATDVMEAMYSSLKERYKIENEKAMNPERRILENNDRAVNEAVSITCKELHDRILVNDRLLIIDTRPRQDFINSKFSKGTTINIASDIIERGESTTLLRERLLTTEDKNIWSYRDEFEQIILLDWDTEVKNLAPGSKLQLLKDILLIFDAFVTYKNNPLILDGGYKRFLESYPSLTNTTQAKPKLTFFTSGLKIGFIQQNQYRIENRQNQLRRLNKRREWSRKLMKKWNIVALEPTSIVDFPKSLTSEGYLPE